MFHNVKQKNKPMSKNQEQRISATFETLVKKLKALNKKENCSVFENKLQVHKGWDWYLFVHWSTP